MSVADGLLWEQEAKGASPLTPTVDSNQKGQIAVLAVEARAAYRGIIVSRPTIEIRYDLVLDWSGRLYRAQVKYGAGKSAGTSGVTTVDLRKGDAKDKTYKISEIDLLFVYLPEINRVCCFGPEIFHDKQILYIRTEPPKKNAKNCLFADQFFW